jgi:pyrimidine operon attenuation protein/uracil phosphoribosyltransferase
MNKTLILSHQQIGQKISRIAHEIIEHNYEEKGIVIFGISERGFLLAQKIAHALHLLSEQSIELHELFLNKKSYAVAAELPVDSEHLKNKVVLVVDDVLNTGKTILYALQPFLAFDLKKLSVVVLVDRDHKLYPVRADHVGLTIATTLQEHISADFTSHEQAVYLI